MRGVLGSGGIRGILRGFVWGGVTGAMGFGSPSPNFGVTGTVWEHMGGSEVIAYRGISGVFWGLGVSAEQ